MKEDRGCGYERTGNRGEKGQEGVGVLRAKAGDIGSNYSMLIFLNRSLDLLNKIRYILSVVALLENCDVTNNGRHLGRHLGFYQELEIRLKPREMVMFCALHEK